jgi:glucosamine--fructose-6-phosphate aminotransferase (isomerizing)
MVKCGIEFLAVTCVGNELARLGTRTLTLPATDESVVMTFTSMLMALQYIAARFAKKDEFVESLRSLPASLSSLLTIYGPKIEEFAERSFENAAFLGQGALYPIASEIALNVMETSSTYAQFFHTLEFRHGAQSPLCRRRHLWGRCSQRQVMRMRARYCRRCMGSAHAPWPLQIGSRPKCDALPISPLNSIFLFPSSRG